MASIRSSHKYSVLFDVTDPDGYGVVDRPGSGGSSLAAACFIRWGRSSFWTRRAPEPESPPWFEPWMPRVS